MCLKERPAVSRELLVTVGKGDNDATFSALWSGP
jgi:hypothetical protein